MGRKSIRENKSVYQLAREKRGLTLEKAGELMDGISSERIQKLESGTAQIQPEDVMLMAKCYRSPELCNIYCTHECAIGRVTMEEVAMKSFSQIAVETLNGLNRMDRQKDRLLEIVEDGRVDREEYEDFRTIRDTLDKIAASVSSLRLWIDSQIAMGELDKDLFGKEKKEMKRNDQTARE